MIIEFLVGLPASGKSTFVAETRFHNDMVASSDAWIEKVAAEKGLTYNECFKDHIKDADKYFYDTIDTFIKQNLNGTAHKLYIDRTNMSVKSRKKTLDFIKSTIANHEAFTGETYKVSLWCTVFEVNNIEWLRRLNSRPGKTIPMGTLISMAENFEYPSEKEGFDYIDKVSV